MGEKTTARKRLASSSSSDEGVTDPLPQKRLPSDNESSEDELQTSSAIHEKEKTTARKRLASSSSSDEGVNDPLPEKTPPSDHEGDVSKQLSSRGSSRSSSRSSMTS